MCIFGLDICVCCVVSDVVEGSVLCGVVWFEGLEFLVYIVRIDCGQQVFMFGFVGVDGEGFVWLVKLLVLFFIGCNVLDWEVFWYDYWKQDCFWLLFFVYIWGLIDCCLWFLVV